MVGRRPAMRPPPRFVRSPMSQRMLDVDEQAKRDWGGGGTRKGRIKEKGGGKG